MKASELRIGNWINIIGLVPTQVVPKHIEFISEGDDQYDPIPLTEEWLLKFGFEPNGVYKSMRLLLPSNELEPKSFIIVTFDEEAWIEIHSRRTEFCGDREIEREIEMQTHMFRCAYVHQLQNLWHSLTGEELTINTIEP